MSKMKTMFLVFFVLIASFVSFDASAQCTTPGECSVEEALGTSNKECHPKPFVDMFQGCLFCHLFKTIFNAVSAITAKAYAIFAEPVVNVMVVFLAVWIAIKTIGYVSQFKKEANAKDYIDDILEKGFTAFIIIFFLKSDGMAFFTQILEPIFNTGFNIAEVLLDTGASCASDNKYGITENGGLPMSMGISVLCVIEQLQASIANIMALGMTSFCVGLYIESVFGLPFLPDWAFLITGILLFLGAFVLLVVYPFIILDSVIQLSVAVSLLPVAMGCYLFKATRSYAQKVWFTFMTTVFTFVFLCLIMVVLIKTIESIVADQILSSITAALENNTTEMLLELIGWDSVLFLKVIFMFFLAKVMLGEVNNFASEFSQGGGFKFNMGQKVGGLIAGGATKMGKRALSPVKKGAKNMYERGKTSFQRMRTQQRANTQIKKYERLKKEGKLDATGRYTQGNLSYFMDSEGKLVRELKKGNKIITKSYGVDATGRHTRDVDTLNTKTGERSKLHHGYDQISKQYIDSKGNVYKDSTKALGARRNNLLRGDGTFNKKNMARLKEGKTMLEEKLASETDPKRIAALHRLMANEDEMLNKLFIESSFGNVFSGDYFRQERGFKSRTAFANGMQEIGADGSMSTYTVDLDGDRPLMSLTKVNKDNSSVSLKTDGLLQIRTIVDKNGVKKTRYAINDKSIINGKRHAGDLNKILAEYLKDSKMSDAEKQAATDYIRDAMVAGKKNPSISAFR